MSDTSTKNNSSADFSLFKADPEAHQVWRWRRSLKIGKTQDSGDLQKCYEAMPKGMYTRNLRTKEENVELVTGPRPKFLNPHDVESIFDPKHRTKKEVRGSNPVKRRRLIAGKHKTFRGKSLPNQANPNQIPSAEETVFEAKQSASRMSKAAEQQQVSQFKVGRSDFGTAELTTKEYQNSDEDEGWEDIPFEYGTSGRDNDISCVDDFVWL